MPPPFSGGMEFFMGNCMQTLSETVTLLASDDTWIEGAAIQQLHTSAALPGMARVAGMPDLHPGRGYPVGAAFFAVGHVYPALIGGDIGCGMALWRTDLAVGKLSADKLDKRLGNLDGPLDEDWRERVAALALPASGFDSALGTIGGGNHFAELQRVDRIYDTERAAALALDPKRLLLLVHSGSRGLGQAILREQVDRHGHAGLLEDSADCAAYLARHDAGLRFAEANRLLIARRMLERLRADGEALLDVNHNLVSPARIGGVDGWLHCRRHAGGCRLGGDSRFARGFHLSGGAAAQRAEPVVAGARRRPQMDAQRVQGPAVAAFQPGAAGAHPLGRPGDLPG